MPYLDEKARTEGPGHCGVYRVEVSSSTSKGNVELITSDIARPNGIAFDGDDLYVSECCQGSHLNKCTSGISRWEILHQQSSRGSEDSPSWIRSATIEDSVSPGEGLRGCSDGFAVYTFGKQKKKRVLLASCFGGLCVVDLELGEVVARMWTTKAEYGGCQISNVAVGEEYVLLTGSCGVLTLPLREKDQSNMVGNQSLDTEL